jgi:hypothetical protein
MTERSGVSDQSWACDGGGREPASGARRAWESELHEPEARCSRRCGFRREMHARTCR